MPFYNWGGIYVGLNAGYTFGTVSPTGLGNFNTNGFLGGGTVGFNYQWAAIVAGLEGDWDYSNVSTTDTFPGAGTFQSNWVATARGRLGYAFDRILVFATGGAAFAPASIPGFSTTMTGWTGGAGVEVAVAPNWTVKAEYLYIDFPNPSLGGTNFRQNRQRRSRRRELQIRSVTRATKPGAAKHTKPRVFTRGFRLRIVVGGGFVTPASHEP